MQNLHAIMLCVYFQESVYEQSPISCILFSQVQVFVFVFNFVDVIFQIVGRHAGGTD